MRHATCPAVRFIRSLGSPLQRGAPFKYVDPGSLSPRLRCWLFAKPQPYEPTLHVEKCRKCRKNARCWLFDCAESFQTTGFRETVVCFMSVGSKRQHFREKQDNPVPFVGFFRSERKNSQLLFMPPCRNVVYFLKTRFFTTSVHNFPGLKGVSTGNAAIFYGFPIFIQHTPGHKG